MSEDTARLIDSEVRRLVEEGETHARQVLTDNLDQLHKLALALLEYETLNGDEAKTRDQGRGHRPRRPRQPRPATARRDRLVDPQVAPPGWRRGVGGCGAAGGVRLKQGGLMRAPPWFCPASASVKSDYRTSRLRLTDAAG